MVRTARYWYMVFPGAGPFEMLFDLEAELERRRRLLAQWNKPTEEGACPAQPDPEKARRKAKPQEAVSSSPAGHQARRFIRSRRISGAA